jgi:hypothetical protein
MLLDTGDVRRRDLREDLDTAVGNSDVDLAWVGFTPFPLHESTALESVDQASQPALVENDGISEFGDRQLPVASDAELKQHVERREGYPVLLLELAIQCPNDVGVSPEEA